MDECKFPLSFYVTHLEALTHVFGWSRKTVYFEKKRYIRS